MQERIQIKGISANTLKILAIIGMTFNHIAHIYVEDLSFVIGCALYAFGGLTFPIMAYLLGEGYRHTTNIKKYAIRLFVFACIAEVPFRLFLNRNIGNILFTLFLGLIAIYSYERMGRKAYFFLFVCLVIVSGFFDWGWIGIPMILLYYTLRDKKRVVLPCLIPLLFFSFIAIVDIMRTESLRSLEIVFFLIGCILSMPLLLCYNGSKGKPMKYFFYVYYPLHILVLGVCRMVFI